MSINKYKIQKRNQKHVQIMLCIQQERLKLTSFKQLTVKFSKNTKKNVLKTQTTLGI